MKRKKNLLKIINNIYKLLLSSSAMKSGWEILQGVFSLKKGLMFLFIFLLFLPSLFAASVDPAVDKAFAEGKDEVAVIITLNPVPPASQSVLTSSAKAYSDESSDNPS